MVERGDMSDNVNQNPEQKTTAAKSTETSREVYSLLKSAYSRAHQAIGEGHPVAWVMVGSMAEEILQAMDVVAVYPENYSAVCAAKKVALDFITQSESEGYSNTICGYARTGLGYAKTKTDLGAVPANAPMGGMAEPAMMVSSSYACDTRYKWFQSMARYVDKPHWSIDVLYPPRNVDIAEVEKYYLDYQVEQLKALVAFLEKHTGRKLDYDRLSELVEISNQTRRMWWECYQLRKAVPSPMPTQDMFSCVAPAKFNPFDAETQGFYQRLRDELRHRVDNRIGVVPDEKYRLMFVGLPPWHGLNLFNYLESQGAVMAIENCYYPGEPPTNRDEFSDPLRRIATDEFRRWTELWPMATQGCGFPDVERICQFAKDYAIDGIVVHTAISCRVSATSQVMFSNIARDFIDVPIMVISSDMVDDRTYSEVQTKSKLDAFMEVVDTFKKKSAAHA